LNLGEEYLKSTNSTGLNGKNLLEQK